MRTADLMNHRPTPSDEWRGYLVANVERLNQFLQVGLPELEKDHYSICMPLALGGR